MNKLKFLYRKKNARSIVVAAVATQTYHKSDTLVNIIFRIFCVFFQQHCSLRTVHFSLMSYRLLLNQFYRHIIHLIDFFFQYLHCCCIVLLSGDILLHSTSQFTFFSNHCHYDFYVLRNLYIIWHFKCCCLTAYMVYVCWTIHCVLNDKFYDQFYFFQSLYKGKWTKIKRDHHVIVLPQIPLHFHSSKSENNRCRDSTPKNCCDAIIISINGVVCGRSMPTFALN